MKVQIAPTEDGCTIMRRSSMFSSEMNTMVFDMSYGEFTKCYDKWNSGGELIQNAFYMLNASEREFIMTGITDSQWDGLFN